MKQMLLVVPQVLSDDLESTGVGIIPFLVPDDFTPEKLNIAVKAVVHRFRSTLDLDKLGDDEKYGLFDAIEYIAMDEWAMEGIKPSEPLDPNSWSQMTMLDTEEIW